MSMTKQEWFDDFDKFPHSYTYLKQRLGYVGFSKEEVYEILYIIYTTCSYCHDDTDDCACSRDE